MLYKYYSRGSEYKGLTIAMLSFMRNLPSWRICFYFKHPKELQQLYLALVEYQHNKFDTVWQSVPVQKSEICLSALIYFNILILFIL